MSDLNLNQERIYKKRPPPLAAVYLVRKVRDSWLLRLEVDMAHILHVAQNQTEQLQLLVQNIICLNILRDVILSVPVKISVLWSCYP
jgi:hypothetical protein